MSRARSSCLVILMIVLQSLTALVEAHAFDQFDPAHSTHDTSHPALSDTPHQGDHADSAEEKAAIDHIPHCSHHGCHCPLLLSGAVDMPMLVSLSSSKRNPRDSIPDAPITSLFRPPIA